MIEPGSPDDSELIRRLTLPRGHDEVMPAIGDPLPNQQVKIIRRWIAQGARWPDSFEIQKHWSYVSPQRPPLPEVSDSSWEQSPIDRFVLHRLEQEGLSPSPTASPEKLVRRLYLDLIGLPPSPEQVEEFWSQPSDQRVERLVDELLSSPQFGERWARPWLDLARYADSHGFQRDNLRDVWAYRDWVIQAINDDMPFDQFTIEQIAGDLIPGATESQKIATGFHRCTPTNVEAGSLPEETRTEQVIDRVNTTGAVWLGTTLECCQCHDHKYDPFSIKEYYRLLAFFDHTEIEADRASKSPSSIKFLGPMMPISNDQRESQRNQIQKQIDGVKTKLRQRRTTLDGDLTEWIDDLRANIADAPQTHSLAISDFQSEGTTDSVERLEDDSILLVGGDPPDTDSYTARVSDTINGVRGFRIDVLRHDSLPGGGPGRGDPKRRNFVLNDFSVQMISPDHETSLKFVEASSDFSQRNWDVGEAIDDDKKSGWAISPMFKDDHWATFVLEKPINMTADSELVFTLTQSFGQARTIGRFRLSALTGNLDSDSVPAAIAKSAAKPDGQWTKVDRKRLLQYCVTQDESSKQLDSQVKKLEQRIESVAPDTTLVMIEKNEPRMTAIYERGDYRNPGEPVQAGTPAILHPMPDGPPNRLTLARWLASPENPLVARVTVNRWWTELFGAGIVDTPEDFGIKGETPSHPELLDWLAVEFVENGWSMKRLLKTIVLSSTYQQSSNVSTELLELDDQNRFLARGPSLRMDAEMIRDNALAISGLLNPKAFGPPIRPYQPDGLWSKVGGTAYEYEVSPGAEQYRRGVYIVLKRGSPYPSLINFDATPRIACTVKRSRTNTPLQALTLLNDPVYVDAAKALADRVAKEKPNASVEEQIEHAFALCTARRPTDSELSTLLRLYDGQNDTNVEPTIKHWYSIATTLLNLHETITKD